MMKKFYRNLAVARRIVDWRALRINKQSCSLCGFWYLVKFGNNEHSVRCLRCGANPSAMCMVDALLNQVPDLSAKTVYELSSRGPFFKFLQERAGKLVFSEYFDDVPGGDSKDSVLCQDVQNLTFPDHSFDVCTSLDVLEHVPDDKKAFSEIYRVLKPGGYFVLTVPLNIHRETVERAKMLEGEIQHILPPEFHDDHIRGQGQVLCFRNYGADIVNRLEKQGFQSVEIVSPAEGRWWGYGRCVVVASRIINT